jgi:hypothetical protein
VCRGAAICAPSDNDISRCACGFTDVPLQNSGIDDCEVSTESIIASAAWLSLGLLSLLIASHSIHTIFRAYHLSFLRRDIFSAMTIQALITSALETVNCALWAGKALSQSADTYTVLDDVLVPFELAVVFSATVMFLSVGIEVAVLIQQSDRLQPAVTARRTIPVCLSIAIACVGGSAVIKSLDIVAAQGVFYAVFSSIIWGVFWLYISRGTHSRLNETEMGDRTAATLRLVYNMSHGVSLGLAIFAVSNVLYFLAYQIGIHTENKVLAGPVRSVAVMFLHVGAVVCIGRLAWFGHQIVEFRAQIPASKSAQALGVKTSGSQQANSNSRQAQSGSKHSGSKHSSGSRPVVTL